MRGAFTNFMEDMNSFESAFSRAENKVIKRKDGISEPTVASEEVLQQGVISSYRKKLIQEVQRKLQRALDLPSQRGDVLHQLFTDIALEVDSRAKARLFSDENCESPRPRNREHPLCFYEVLAEHYARIPGDGDTALALFVKLWSQSLTAQIFTLLFYEWLFEVPTEDSDGYLRYSTAFVEGASTIFWIDMQSNVQRFFSLYDYTLNEVIMNPQRLSRLPSQTRCELVLMLSRFFFFYEPAARLQDFFAHFPPFPSNLGPADVFVIELADQLQKVKVEPALLHYLKKAEVLKVQLKLYLLELYVIAAFYYGYLYELIFVDIPLRLDVETLLVVADAVDCLDVGMVGLTTAFSMNLLLPVAGHFSLSRNSLFWAVVFAISSRQSSPTGGLTKMTDLAEHYSVLGLQLNVPTSTRLRTTLYGLTSPGGPMYPTRPVRHAARETLDCLFPVGRNSRHLISLVFRLLHPYYWPISLWNFMATTIIGIVQRIHLKLYNLWESAVGRHLST